MANQIVRTPKQAGEALRRQRRAQGITQQGLSAKARQRQATISRLEAGEPGTSLATLFDILTALNLELEIRPRTKASKETIEELF